MKTIKGKQLERKLLSHNLDDECDKARRMTEYQADLDYLKVIIKTNEGKLNYKQALALL